jgi:hypothetical protein
MAIANTQSQADRAYERFVSLSENRAILRQSDRTLTEADTRAKLIDPLFKSILGWSESEIRREEPVTKGFVDYVLGSEFDHLLIEAKRVEPRFHLHAPGKARRLMLNGPHLLGNKKVRDVLHQGQGYAADLGVQFCIVTNGSQLIIFKPFVPGRSWRVGTAIVYHDHEDIRDNFAEFYALLARDQVLAGSLVQAFEHVEKTTTQLLAPISFLSDPDRELIRNDLWDQIARTMAPLLRDQPEDLAAQLEVIRHCYVNTKLGDRTDKNLDALLKDTGARLASKAAIVDLKPGTGGKTAFSHRLEEDLYAGRRGAYILTGGVGSGKTTFLRRFAHIVDRDFVDHHTAWIHVDYLPIGNVDPSVLDQELRLYTYKQIRKVVTQRFQADLIGDGAAVRALFDQEISEARLTLLHGVAEDSGVWNSAVNQLVDQLFQDDERFVFAALRRLRGRGRRICVVMDNTDQLGEAFQERVFLFAQKLSSEYLALCIVTLREEKFFAAYRRGIFDAFGDRRFHIGSPDLKNVLRKRLEYGRQKFAQLETESGETALKPEDFKRIDALLKALINSATAHNANIVRMLATVSNGDMRHALDMFREFLSSGNTDINKIIRIVEKSGGYSVPFHEFAKSAILGSRRFYRSNVSHIANVFKQSDAIGASHLTACRILARLSAAEGVASAHGEGFVAVSALLKEYRESFGFADDFVQWTGELLRRDLVESEPPRVGDIRQADAIRVTAAGAYYWRYLIRSFSYIDLMFVDTPVADIGLAKRLATLAEMTDMTVRFERVRAYLEYLETREKLELAACAARLGPFQEALMPQVCKQIEAEIRLISKKLPNTDLYGPEDED